MDVVVYLLILLFLIYATCMDIELDAQIVTGRVFDWDQMYWKMSPINKYKNLMTKI